MIRDRYDQVEQDDRERRRRRRDAEDEKEMQEAIRQNRHENRVIQARLKKPMPQDQVMNKQILRELAKMREMMTTRREGGRRQLDEAIEEVGKTPFATQIQMSGIPPKCSLPIFTNIYDGTTCAIQHIKACELYCNGKIMMRFFASIFRQVCQEKL